MSAPTTTFIPLATYRNDAKLPFCPGCGHHAILDHLNRALVTLKIDPREVVLVSDIGCSGLSDQYFATSAFHGLHGRSITYASGIKLARPDLKVIVIVGDGGTGIGGAHLLNAARRNIGLTVLVFNNFNFGMTGGQHSTTTPAGAITATTPGGNLERPLDLCATAAANGAGYVWRGTSFDSDLSDRIVEAVRADCFALLDIWELCTAYFVPSNHATRRTLATMLHDLGFASGLVHRAAFPEFAAAYRVATGPLRGKPLPAPHPIAPRFASDLDRPFRLVIAGSAGGKVRSAGRLVAEAALLSGLWASQRDDYPITVKTGHSLAEVTLSPQPLEIVPAARPDAIVLLSADGAAKAAGLLAEMAPGGRVFTLPELADAAMGASVTLVEPDEAPARIPTAQQALYAAAVAVKELGLVPVEALVAAAEIHSGAHASENVATIRAAVGQTG